MKYSQDEFQALVLNEFRSLGEVLQEFASSVDKRFNAIDERFSEVDKRFDEVDRRFDEMDRRFERLEERMNTVERTMVTKDYLDGRLRAVEVAR